MDNKKIVNLPISSSKSNLKNKDINYNILAIMTLYSNI